MAIIYCRPRLTSNGSGTSGDPYQPSQVAANVSSGDTVRFLYDAYSIGGFNDSGFGSTTIEIGTHLSAGVEDVTFETAPGETAEAIITGTIPLAGTSNWTKVSGSTNVYQQFVSATAASIFTKLVQDLFGEVGSVTGEGSGPRRRHLHKVAIADDTDPSKAALDADEGAWGVTEVVAGAIYRIVCHCWGSENPSARGSGFMRYSRTRTATGFHKKGAISLIECRNIQFKDLRIDGFYEDVNSVGLSVQTTFPGTNDVHPGVTTVRNVNVFDCSGGSFAALCNTEESGNEVNIQSCRMGGIGVANLTRVISVGNFSGASLFDSVQIQDSYVYGHSILEHDSSAALTQPSGSEELDCIRVFGQSVGSGVTNVMVKDTEVIGKAGASAKVVGINLRAGSSPPSGSEWNWNAYGAQVDGVTFTGIPQIYIDHDAAFRRVSGTVGNGTDAFATSTGPCDIGTGSVDTLWQSTSLNFDATGGDTVIGVSENGRIRMVACDIATTVSSAAHPVFKREGGSNSRNQLIAARNVIFRTLSSQTKFADMGSAGSTTDFDLKDTVLDDFVDDAAFVEEPGGNLDKSGLQSASDNLILDISAAYESDEITPTATSAVRDYRLVNDEGVGVPSRTDGFFYNGQIGASQQGTLGGGRSRARSRNR